MSAVHESSLTAAPSSVPPTVTASTTSAGAPVASSSVPSAGTSTGHAAATEDPVKALDHMAGEPSILDKAKGIAQPVSLPSIRKKTAIAQGEAQC